MLQKYLFEKKKFCIIPNKNLVGNNGIDKFAQNTTKENVLNKLDTTSMLSSDNNFLEVVHDKENDLWEEKNIFCNKKSILRNYVCRIFD